MRTNSILGLGLVLLLVASACSDDGPVIGPGSENNDRPPINDGTGMPDNTTGETCTSSSDCAYWYCECTDGAVVNSVNCTNGYCLDASGACPGSCEVFGHGAWTGSAGGGPVDNDPPTCSIGSASSACETCYEDNCCAEGNACAANTSCLDYWDCALLCEGDAFCRSDCDAIYPDGRYDYEDLEGCLQSACYDECGF